MADVLDAAAAVPRALGPDWWAGGLTLAERRALHGAPTPAPDLVQRAVRRLARWREAHGLGESGLFDRRLAAAGVTEPDLLALLAEDRAGLAARAARPDWAGVAEAALARTPEARSAPEPIGTEAAAALAGFSVIITPFTELACERFLAAAAAEGLGEAADPAELRSGLADSLARRLVPLASRTLVLELNVLRLTGQLTGATPQQRFSSFVRQLSQRAGLTALLEEYPVLARLLAQATVQAAESWLELLRRFDADRARIVARVFGGVDPGRLVEVATGWGDTHRRGRSVAVLRFEAGARLVYKPRPLAAHVHFNQCVDWLNRQLPDLGLRTLAVLNHDRYGWMEFAVHRPCQDRAGLERYYRRQGALLALLYALEGADFHFENLIASADQPVLVDLEALLHPVLPAAGPDLVTMDPAREVHEASVSRVGLLPALVFGEDGAALDLSGNGGDPGAQLPFKTAGWADAGTDEMRLVRAQPQFPGSQNRPRLGDVTADAADFAAGLLEGFRTAYDAIAAHAGELAAVHGLLGRFAGDELRVVVRATRVYADLLDESTHPDVLRDALDRDRILDYLWALSKDDPSRQRLIDHEQADLWAGDVPLFAVRPDSRDVWTSVGKRLPALLAEAGLERSAGKLQRVGPRDRRVQEWIIRASLATRRATSQDGGGDVMGRGQPRPAGRIDPERALAAALAVGDRLAESAYRHRRRVGWLGMHLAGESRWLVRPLDYDLYSGYPGVAVFLSQLAALTGRQRYAELARRIVAPIEQLAEVLDGRPAGPPRSSAFGSLAGVAYALVHVAANLAAPELAVQVAPLVVLAASGVGEDEALDVIGGSAGGLVAMLSIHQATGLAGALDAARACADRLVETARPRDVGVAWAAAMPATQPLTGFSHGAAGMGWALLRFATATGQARYAKVGLDAFGYERSLYRPELGNWPDFRVAVAGPGPAPDSPSAISAWCHGAPGIGLARADSGHLHLPEVAADLDLALRSQLAAGPSPNLSLCHGQLGNLELLTVAAADTPERTAWAAHALASFEKEGPRCGTPRGSARQG